MNFTRLVNPRSLPLVITTMLFALLYGCFRFLVEFVREPDAQLGYLAFGWLTMGQVLSLPLILLGGITNRETMDLAMAEGFDFVAMGRALLREPDLPRRLAVDPTVHSQCTHCNLCMPTIYTHTRCPVRTGEAIG